MVTPTLHDVLAAALGLAIEEQARLTNVLVEILVEDQAPGAGRSAKWWQEEIERRATDADEGRVKWIDGHEAMARPRAAIRARQCDR